MCLCDLKKGQKLAVMYITYFNGFFEQNKFHKKFILDVLQKINYLYENKKSYQLFEFKSKIKYNSIK